MTIPLLLRHTTRAAAALAVAVGLIFSSTPAQAQSERQTLQDLQALSVAPMSMSATAGMLERGGDIVADPSFEAGRVPDFWTATNPGYLGGTPIFSPNEGGPDLARTGDYYAILGSSEDAINTGIEQNVTVTAGNYDLQVWLLAGDNPDSESEFFIEFAGTELTRFALDDVFQTKYDGTYGLVEVPITVDTDGTYTLSLLQTKPAGPLINWFLDDVAIVPSSGAIPIAEARALGVDAEVIIEGVVSRAKGDFAYIQDETAGLTIRQTSGTFFDEVADGTISEGTELLISGTLSEFSGLLQINEEDLASYEILSDGDAPEPQSIVLQDIVENGEDYESELVRITGLTIDGKGTFSPATNYQVSDDSASDTLRVPNADDSDIDGTEIPETEFVFEGVVGQFDSFGDNAGNGYQLLAIEATDILAGSIVEEAIHDTGDVQFEVYDFGELGAYADADGVPLGTGFVFNGDNGLYESTFLVGVSPDQVSGDAYEFPDLEWATTSPLAEAIAPDGYDQAFSAGYNDGAAANPIGVEVDQLSYSAEDDDFVIVEFDVTNTSGADLTEVYLGLFADWDVGTFDQNVGAYDEGGQVLYVWDNTGTSTNYFGITALNGENGVDVSGVFYDALPGDDLLYTGLSNTTPDATNPADRRTVLGVGPYDITAGETVTVQFAYVGGTDEQDLIANAFAAQAAVAPPLEQAIHDTGTVQFEVFADGDLGTDAPDFTGTGFVFGEDNGLFTSQFVVGASPDQVSGVYYGEGEWITDEPLVAAAPPSGFGQAFGASFDDSGAANPIGVEVDQLSYSAMDDDYVVVRYTLENTTADNLDDLYVGIFADWDVGDFAQNLAGFDAETNLLYVYDESGTSSNYFGVTALGDVPVSGVYYEALGGTETDADIYTYLTTVLPEPTTADDRRATLGVGPYSIAAGEEIVAEFAFVGGTDLADIIANANAAQGNPVASEETTQAGTFALHSAYPNPFASTTTLGFSLPAAEHVRLTVYDVLGRRVATLIDGPREAGEQTIRFDASNLGSGTYIYRLEAGGTQLTERFTVVR